jgi:chemotaxis protein MotB
MLRIVASLALVFALATTGCVSNGTFKKKEAEAAKFRQDWEDEVAKRAVLQEKISAMQQQLETLIADANALREKVRSDEGTLSQKEAELRAVRDRLVETQALVDELSKSKRKLEAAKAELEKKSGEYEQLASALRGEIEAGRVELMELRGRTTVKMKDKILFASGSSTIGAEGRDALRKVAQALRGLQAKAIRVDGHTDDVPTGAGGPFATNWELSSARALAVVRFLQDAGVDPTRLSAAGFGEFQPIESNETPEGRSLNRRIEITLVPIEGAVAAEARPASKT